jgi:glyoxylate reductase
MSYKEQVMDKRKILVTYPLPSEGLQELQKRFDVTVYKKGYMPKPELLKSVRDCDGLLPVGVEVDEEVIEASSRLKMISVFGSGYDNVDIKAATNRGIIVTNIPDTVTDAAAELTMGLIISAMRRISEFDRRLRTEDNFRWDMEKNMGRLIYGKELGIIGMGRIGKATAKRAAAFGMRISYYNRKRLDPVIEMELDANFKRLDDLLPSADVISIHTPLTKETRHLIGERELSMMKEGAYLINTSRGAVIDEKALIRYLAIGKLAGAALDVYEDEPDIPSALLKMDNIVLTPHIGADTFETRLQMTREATKSFIDFFSGRKPFHIVNPQVLE